MSPLGTRTVIRPLANMISPFLEAGRGFGELGSAPGVRADVLVLNPLMVGLGKADDTACATKARARHGWL